MYFAEVLEVLHVTDIWKYKQICYDMSDINIIWSNLSSWPSLFQSTTCHLDNGSWQQWISNAFCPLSLITCPDRLLFLHVIFSLSLLSISLLASFLFFTSVCCFIVLETIAASLFHFYQQPSFHSQPLHDVCSLLFLLTWKFWYLPFFLYSQNFITLLVCPYPPRAPWEMNRGVVITSAGIA